MVATLQLPRTSTTHKPPIKCTANPIHNAKIKPAKLKPLQENVATIMWMPKQWQYTRNTRSKAFTAAQNQAHHSCRTSSKWFRCSHLCLCTSNQNVISLADPSLMGRYTVSTGEELLRENRACIFSVRQSFECRQLFTGRNCSATKWIFSNKRVLTSNLLNSHYPS